MTGDAPARQACGCTRRRLSRLLTRLLEHLLAELDLTMALSGVTSVAEITRDLLVPRA